jgi:predicted nucleic acid-binding protein
MGRQQVVQKLEVFVEDRRVDCDRKTLFTVSELYLQHTQISFLDAYLVVSARAKGGRLSTFDKQLAKKLPSMTNLL